VNGDATPARDEAALAGLRVLDLSRVLAGPWASQILGDLGAEVWKIEKPGKGDDTRGWGPPFLDDGSDSPDAAYYLCCNRNKLSVAVDFADERGAALVRDLALRADIVIENFKPGGLAKYGLDAASLQAERPGLIYCSITGFGQTIDCALLDSQLAVMVNQAMNFLVGGDVPRRLGNAHPNVVPYRDFQAADGDILVAVGNDAQFRRLCEVVGRPDLKADPRYATNAGRATARHELEAALGDAIRLRTRSDLLAALAEAEVPCGPINSLAQALADPHVTARRLVQNLRRDDGTAFNVVGFPTKLSQTPVRYNRAPPRLGAETRAVLRDVLQRPDAEIEALEAAGVLGLDDNAARSCVQGDGR
jgi:crotonobetainyl-CoA:carnitine CoA-transferase CaiB-like acyl-CoA transferase